MDVLGFIMRYEGGECEPAEIIDGFAYLIETGLVWDLQGSYGRAAEGLIQRGLVSPDGDVLDYPED